LTSFLCRNNGPPVRPGSVGSERQQPSRLEAVLAAAEIAAA